MSWRTSLAEKGKKSVKGLRIFRTLAYLDIGMWNRFVDLVVRFHLLAVENDVGSLVAHGITIIWRRKDCDALAIVGDLIAHVFDFVRADDVVEFVSFEEVLGDIGT
jgi:hypothetical protein